MSELPKPSELLERVTLPIVFPGALKKAEAEHAALLVVWASARNGDSWDPVPEDVFYPSLEAFAVDPKFSKLWENPFFRPEPSLIPNYFPTKTLDREVINRLAKSVGIEVAP